MKLQLPGFFEESLCKNTVLKKRSGGLETGRAAATLVRTLSPLIIIVLRLFVPVGGGIS